MKAKIQTAICNSIWIMSQFMRTNMEKATENTICNSIWKQSGKSFRKRLLYFTASWHIAACSWCKQQASSASAFCEWNDLGSDLVWYWSWRSLLSLQESKVQMYRSCRGCRTCCHAGSRRPVRPRAAEHVLRLDPEVKQLRSTLNINTMNILIYPSEFFSK